MMFPLNINSRKKSFATKSVANQCKLFRSDSSSNEERYGDVPVYQQRLKQSGTVENARGIALLPTGSDPI